MSMRVLSPTAILGYGFPEDSFTRGLEMKPDFIAVDAGSTDPGPYYLGEGISFTDRAAVKRDLRHMLKGGCSLGVPVAIGSAGGCGGRIHLDWNLGIIRELAREEGLHFKLAVIDTEVPKTLVESKLRSGAIRPLGPIPQLTEEELRETTRIVGQVGMEPYMEAFGNGAQVILCGRAYDPAVFACLPVMKGYGKALALHMGKILECAAIAAVPGSGSDCMMGTLDDDGGFIVEPMSGNRSCTVTSVAAHTLYEKSDPYHLPGPGGELDLTGTRFEQLDDRRVRVSGTAYVPSDGLHIKLEGARKIGYRTVSIAGARDPIFIEKIDGIVEGVKARTADNFPGVQEGKDYHLRFVVYGKDGVMGPLEPIREPSSHELGIVIDAVASSQELANTICSFARSTLLHFGYPGRKSTAGNLALLYSPSDLKMGAVYEFSVHHLMKVEDHREVARITYEEV